MTDWFHQDRTTIFNGFGDENGYYHLDNRDVKRKSVRFDEKSIKFADEYIYELLKRREATDGYNGGILEFDEEVRRKHYDYLGNYGIKFKDGNIIVDRDGDIQKHSEKIVNNDLQIKAWYDSLDEDLWVREISYDPVVIVFDDSTKKYINDDVSDGLKTEFIFIHENNLLLLNNNVNVNANVNDNVNDNANDKSKSKSKSNSNDSDSSDDYRGLMTRTLDVINDEENTDFDGSQYDQYEDEKFKLSHQVIEKPVVDCTPIFVPESIYCMIDPEYAEFIRCHKILNNGTAMIRHGLMTINDIAILIEHPERGHMMGKFVNKCMYQNNGNGDLNVATMIFQYCLSLGYSPAYSNLLVQQIASTFNR